MHRLSGSGESLTALCYQYGFCDQSHFIKLIRKLAKVPPGRLFREGTQLGTEDTYWFLEQPEIA